MKEDGGDVREQHGLLEGHRLPGPHLTPVPVWASTAVAEKMATAAEAQARPMASSSCYRSLVYDICSCGIMVRLCVQSRLKSWNERNKAKIQGRPFDPADLE